MRENGPQCDLLPNVRRDLSIYTTGVEGREVDIDWLLDNIAKDGVGRKTKTDSKGGVCLSDQ